ncbi:MAG: HI0074 family nucleotidyltransferase substrate-binding subunit [Candidatus Gastranaerophilaceae bacterium]
MMDKLNVKSLNQALESLKTSWNKYKEVPGDEFVRDSVIQRFEYTYALAVKYIQKYLEIILPNSDEVDNYTFNELIRTANEKGLLLGNLEKWATYRQRRNITSHTYNVEKALQVIEIIQDFIEETEFLYNKLK